MKLPIVIAIVISCQAQSPVFEAASVKLNPGGSGGVGVRREAGRLDISYMTMKALLKYAYDIRDIQISDGPAWFDSDHWDIAATAGRAVTEDERKKMLQSLLTERFKMTSHHDTKELPFYALVVAKNGSKLMPDMEGKPEKARAGMKAGLFTMKGEGVSLHGIADVISGFVGRIVIDRTGIQGHFDFQLEWVPDGVNTPSINGAKMEASVEGPSIFTAVQEQLGLKLEATKGPVEVLVIDRAEKAAAN